MSARPPFPRTICACPRDVAQCARPAHLIPSDVPVLIERLVETKRIDPEHATIGGLGTWLRASKGAVVMDSQTGQVVRVGTITPKVRHGQCVFLTKDKQCSIHDVAPFGCAYFDVHMPRAEADQRSLWGLQQIMLSAAYMYTRTLLPTDEGPAGR